MAENGRLRTEIERLLAEYESVNLKFLAESARVSVPMMRAVLAAIAAGHGDAMRDGTYVVVPVLTPAEEAHESAIRIALEGNEWWEKQKAATARGEGRVPLGPLAAAQYAAHLAAIDDARDDQQAAYFAEGAPC